MSMTKPLITRSKLKLAVVAFYTSLLAWLIVIVSLLDASSSISSIWHETNQPSKQPAHKVFIWPQGYPHRTIGELRQILRDGVDRSSRLQQTSDIDEHDVIFAVDLLRSNCDSIEALIQDSLDRRSRNNSTARISTIRKVVLFDFTDGSQMDSWKCLERLGLLLGKERVFYGCREFWGGRNISLIDKSYDEVFGLLGEPRNFSNWQGYGNRNDSSGSSNVHLLRYPVRSDMFEAMEKMIEVDYPAISARSNDRVSLLPRPIDLASFTEVNHKILPSITLRGHVSELVLNMTKANLNISAQVGQKGFADEMGRSIPSEDYMKFMLKSKIVVTAQRDSHEDHYRFFEAILSGALVMTDPMHPLPMGYEHEKNIIVYKSLAELEQQILFYLSHPVERIRIAKAGFEHAMKNHRTWHVVERILLIDE